MRIKEIFKSIMSEDCLEIFSLPGGMTNQSYFVIAPSGHYLLRIPGEGTNEYINRYHEIDNMRMASNLQFAPELVYADKPTGIIIAKYIDGNVPVRKSDLYDSKQLRLLCSKIIQIHRSGMVFSNEFDIPFQMEQYRQILKKMNQELPKELTESLPVLDQAANQLFHNYIKNLVPCHGDTKLNNFLIQGDTIWAIDWEYSGMADEYFDIVNLVMTNLLNDEEESLFLHAYEECAGEVLDRKKYILYKIVVDYLWIYWHLIKLYQGHMVQYNEFSWRNRLSRALNHIAKLEKVE